MTHTVIINGVSYVPYDADSPSPELRQAKSFLTDLICRIQDERSNAQQNYDDFKEDGLKFNAIEAEGNLRAYTTICNLIDHLHSEYYSGVKID